MSKLISVILLIAEVTFSQIIVNPRRAAVINPPVTEVTPLYTLDFEEGNLSDWTHIGANSTAHGDAAHSGSYGMRITSSSSDGSYYALASALDLLYVTFYVYVPDATTFSGTAYSYSAWIYTGSAGGDDKTMWGGHANDVGGEEYKWDRWMVGSSSNDFTDNETNFSRDAWHKIKIYYKKGTGANAEAKIWVDEDLALEIMDKSYTAQATGFQLRLHQPTATGYIYYDDIKLYDENPD